MGVRYISSSDVPKVKSRHKCDRIDYIFDDISYRMIIIKNYQVSNNGRINRYNWLY